MYAPGRTRSTYYPGTLALGVERQSAWMSKITNDRLNPVWYRTLDSCSTDMATVGVKGLSRM